MGARFAYSLALRCAIFGMVLLLGTSSASAAEPLVVDPWRERVPAPTLAVAAFEPFAEIIDPWAGSSAVALYETEEIVDPWADLHPKIPTAVFPLIE